jgi:hypothetical protein
MGPVKNLERASDSAQSKRALARARPPLHLLDKIFRLFVPNSGRLPIQFDRFDLSTAPQGLDRLLLCSGTCPILQKSWSILMPLDPDAAGISERFRSLRR